MIHEISEEVFDRMRGTPKDIVERIDWFIADISKQWGGAEVLYVGYDKKRRTLRFRVLDAGQAFLRKSVADMKATAGPFVQVPLCNWPPQAAKLGKWMTEVKYEVENARYLIMVTSADDPSLTGRDYLTEEECRTCYRIGATPFRLLRNKINGVIAELEGRALVSIDESACVANVVLVEKANGG